MAWSWMFSFPDRKSRAGFACLIGVEGFYQRFSGSELFGKT